MKCAPIHLLIAMAIADAFAQLDRLVKRAGSRARAMLHGLAVFASNFKISTNWRNLATDAMVDDLDTGTGAGTIAIRTGSPPTNVSDASSGTLLGTLTFSGTSFGASATGTATAASITSDTDADASGDAGHFRGYKGAAADTAADFQGTAGEAADSTDMTFDNKTVVAGGTIAISSFTITTPIQ